MPWGRGNEAAGSFFSHGQSSYRWSSAEHSHIEHLFAMLRRAAEEGIDKVRVHALLDGRDVPETSALEYIGRLEAELVTDAGARHPALLQAV